MNKMFKGKYETGRTLLEVKEIMSFYCNGKFQTREKKHVWFKNINNLKDICYFEIVIYILYMLPSLEMAPG